MSPSETPYTQPTPAPERPQRPPAWVRVIGITVVISMVVVALAGIISGIGALIAFSTPPATASTDQAFTMSGAPTLRIDADVANVHITTGAAGQVSVHTQARVRALSTSLAHAALNDMKVVVSQSGDTITITQRSRWFDGLFTFMRNLDVDLVVPQQANISSTLSAGNITATGVHGSLRIETDAGNVTVRDAQLSGTTISTSAGNVRLDDVAIAGATSLSTSAGNMRLSGTLAPHSTLSMRASAGDISLALPLATDAHLRAQTSSGRLTVSGWPIETIHSVTEAAASGDLAPSPTSTIIITTEAGNVTITPR